MEVDAQAPGLSITFWTGGGGHTKSTQSQQHKPNHCPHVFWSVPGPRPTHYMYSHGIRASWVTRYTQTIALEQGIMASTEVQTTQRLHL